MHWKQKRALTIGAVGERRESERETYEPAIPAPTMMMSNGPRMDIVEKSVGLKEGSVEDGCFLKKKASE